MTSYARQRFDITTDTGGDFVDTGPPIWGMILQMALVGPSDTSGGFDTGADLNVSLINTGVTVGDYDNLGGQTRQFAPKQATFDTGGTEIGSEFIFSAGDRPRITINQSAGVTGAKTSTLYIWSGW